MAFLNFSYSPQSNVRQLSPGKAAAALFVLVGFIGSFLQFKKYKRGGDAPPVAGMSSPAITN